MPAGPAPLVHLPRLALLLAGLTLTVSGCSAGSDLNTTSAGSTSSSPATSTVAVVASTDVYGDIVQTIGGEAVSVTSFINDPSRNPHEYAADARNQLALSKAQLVVENGGGYDDFVDTMLASSPSKPTVINVAKLSGYDTSPDGGEFNEHLWYDLPTMVKLTARLSTELAAAAPAAATQIAANAADFTSKLQALEQTEAGIKAEHRGDGVAITEPLPIYLLTAVGLTNKTPEAFSEAIEEGNDVPPAVFQQTLNLFESGKVELLTYDAQNTGPQPEAVLAAARKSDVAVASFTETLPHGDSYLSWMTQNLRSVADGLSAPNRQ